MLITNSLLVFLLNELCSPQPWLNIIISLSLGVRVLQNLSYFCSVLSVHSIPELCHSCAWFELSSVLYIDDSNVYMNFHHVYPAMNLTFLFEYFQATSFWTCSGSYTLFSCTCHKLSSYLGCLTNITILFLPNIPVFCLCVYCCYSNPSFHHLFLGQLR